MNFDAPSAKFSGRGTQMLSRNGGATISHYLCFKRGYTDEELKHTGLRQVVDEEKYNKLIMRQPYNNVKNKVETNLNVAGSRWEYP